MSAVIQQTQAGFEDVAATSLGVLLKKTTTGNMLLAVVETQGDVTISSVSDGTNSFTKIDGTAQTARCELWYAYNITGLTAPTVTANFGAVNAAMVVREYSGVTKTDPLDKHVIAIVNATTALTSGASTAISKAGELVIGYGGVNVSGAWTIGAGYRNMTTSIAAFHGCAIEELIAPGATAQTATFTNAQSGSGACGVAAFLTPTAFRINNLRPAIFKPGIAR